ncbi:MAG TPA: ASPIC/UnbV domain-containing protein [Pyrinomonadaceae bacterium]|nr:ASPIC/UnbV domain-containing protein [Pyrinomonadaceae bacterium]
MLLRNEGRDASGTLRFSDVAMAVGADDIKDGRGMATADFDNDGDLDIVINNNPGDSGRAELSRATLLRNNVGATRGWLAVELRGDGRKSNRDAVGAEVTVEAGGEKQLRLLGAGSGFASQHSARLYFGMGASERADAVVVRWPDGRVERFENVGGQPIGARRLVRITEGAGAELLSLPATQSPPAGGQLVAAK